MKCCICGKKLESIHSNNPQPIRREDGQIFDGLNERCCDACNSKFVIPYRICKIKGYNTDVVEMQETIFALRKAAGLVIKKRYAMCTIERKDGTTYEQSSALVNNSLKMTIRKVQEMLGNNYLVVDARIVEE